MKTIKRKAPTKQKASPFTKQKKGGNFKPNNEFQFPSNNTSEQENDSEQDNSKGL